MTRWFEDVDIDQPFPLGAHTFTEAEIIRFGTLYDPQFFHTDPEAAKSGPFGGLVASGWHTVSVGQRKMVDALFAEEERLRALGQKPGVSGPSPGVNRMDFLAPVRPGDTIAFTLTVTGKRLSNSRPGWGLLFSQIDAVNQDGETVYHAEFVGFTRRRDFRPTPLQALAEWAARFPALRRLVRG